MIIIGELSLWVALLLAAWSSGVSYAGGALAREDFTESGVRGLYATFAMVFLAAIGLWTAFLSRDFSLAYVAGHVGQNTPRAYAFTALWSGQAGSMLLFALILSLCGTIAISTSRGRAGELASWAAGTVSAIVVFFLAAVCFSANPYVREEFTPLGGQGTDPRLQHVAAALHQPALYLGYAAGAVLFAFAIALLFTRRLDGPWLGVARRWTRLCWLFLTIGVLLGMRWAYVANEWGGRWLSDPLLNLSLLPWLANSVLLHFIEKRAPGKWNVVLIGAGFLVSIVATFVTSSGVTTGVLSLAHSRIATWFTAFFFLATGMTVYLAGMRLRGVELASERRSPVSDRRSYGGYVAHAGIATLLGAALIGLPLKRQFDVTLKTAESFQATDPFGHVWRFVSQGVSQFDRADHIVAILALDTYRDGKRVGLITSERRTYRNLQGNQLFEPSANPGIRSMAMLDVYVVPRAIRRSEGTDAAELRIAFNPLVAWVWAAGLVMVAGGVIAIWPRSEQRQPNPGYVGV